MRRCGGMVDATDLKSVLAKSGVWVRIPSSAPSKKRFYHGKSLGRALRTVANGLARKSRKTKSMCQVFGKRGPLRSRKVFAVAETQLAISRALFLAEFLEARIISK